MAQSISLAPYYKHWSFQQPQPAADSTSIDANPKMRVWQEQAISENTLIGGLVWEHLGEAPCLEYRAENTHLYVVTGPDRFVLAVPKARAQPNDYVAPENNLLAWAFRCLGCAVLGLPLAGFGAYPFLILALWLAGRAWVTSSLDLADRTRVQVILAAATVLFAIALLLSWFCLSLV